MPELIASLRLWPVTEDNMAGFGDWLRGLLGKEEPGPGLPRRRSDGPQSFADDNNEFALAVYAKLRQQPGNLFFSPFSIRTALAMTQAGARAETAAQMREALCISSSEETQHVGFAEIISRLNASGRSEYDMAVANSLWAQAGAPLQPEFVDLIARQYGGTLNVVDFRRSAEAGRVTINQWVENKTRQKIRELIPSDALNADTRLVVVNAVHFKGRWMLPFREEATRDEPFHLESGAKVRSRLMHQLEEVRYRQARGYQAVDLFYRGGDLSMLILLPERKGGLRDLEKRVLAGALHDCVAEMVTEKVSLFLPRFKLNGETVNLRNQLTTLGMPLAFSRVEANFSGINGHEPPHQESLFISDVLHKAFVAVDEEGTEAAAATAVSMPCGRRPDPVPTFRADHPFLFALRERKTGAILFLGRVADPTQED